jgi:hypothetical protein
MRHAAGDPFILASCLAHDSPSFVMAGLVPAIHVFACRNAN